MDVAHPEYAGFQLEEYCCCHTVHCNIIVKASDKTVGMLYSREAHPSTPKQVNKGARGDSPVGANMTPWPSTAFFPHRSIDGIAFDSTNPLLLGGRSSTVPWWLDFTWFSAKKKYNVVNTTTTVARVIAVSFSRGAIKTRCEQPKQEIQRVGARMKSSNRQGHLFFFWSVSRRRETNVR